MTTCPTPRQKQRGSALLLVLWLSAALAAIAFTVANTVRGETERTSADVDAVRAYYLATGSVDRALLWIKWGPAYRNPDGSPRYWSPPMPVLHYEYPGGIANVEIIPENSKLNVNTAPPEELLKLLLALGVAPERARVIVQGIVDWRTPAPGITEFDSYYLSLTPSFRSRHASLREIEELLYVRGMTPEIFYGRYDRDAQGNLVPRAALRDCLSVYGQPGALDINTVEPAVMEAVGIPPEAATAIVARRRAAPFRTATDLAQFRGQAPAFARLGLGNSAFITLRATASPRRVNGGISDLRRTVSALVRVLPQEFNPPYRIMRWYDNAPATQ